jgi:hypothetical protein
MANGKKQEKLKELTYEELEAVIKTVLHFEVGEALTERHKILNAKLDSIQNTVDIHVKDIDELDKKIDRVNVDAHTTASELRLLNEKLDKHEFRVVNKVTNNVDSKIEEVTNGMKEEIHNTVQPTVQKTLSDFIEVKGKKLQPRTPRIFDRIFWWKKK